MAQLDITSTFRWEGKNGALIAINGAVDTAGTIPISQLPDGFMDLIDFWNASTNVPYLYNSIGKKGDVYKCNFAGAVDFGTGVISFSAGDLVYYDGFIWGKIAANAASSIFAINTYSFTATAGQTVYNLTYLPNQVSVYYNGSKLTKTQYNASGGSYITLLFSPIAGDIITVDAYVNTLGLGGGGTAGSMAKWSGTSTLVNAVAGTDYVIPAALNAYVPTFRSLTINGTTYDLTADRSWSINPMVYPSAGIAVSTGSAWGTSIVDNSTNWNTAYNRSLVSAAVTGTTTKTLTLNQQSGGTITASWSDLNTDAVTSVFGRTGAVVATNGDYTTSQVTESGNLYYLDSRARAAISVSTGLTYNSTTGVITNTITQYTDANARAAISLTTTGTSGAATYNNTTGILNIPQYQGGVTSFNTRTGAIVPTEGDYSLTQLSDVTLTSPSTNQVLKYNGTEWVNSSDSIGLTSVGVTMPSAFSVSNSPLTSNGTIAVTGAGTTSQYVRGDGSLATYNPGTGGGGASQSFYFNGSVASGVTGYQQMSTTANTGASSDFSVSANGYIASFLTDSGSPNQLLIPAGNWNFEIYMNANSNAGNPYFYVELYKYNGTTFTLISSSVANPEYITNGTQVDLYTTALTVPQTTLLVTDRLAIRVYVNVSGRTITMHTQDSNLSEVITTFTTGITALNGLTAQVQNFATGTSGTDFNISSVTSTHTFNLPTASDSNRGLLSTSDWTTFNGKQNAISLTTMGSSGSSTFVSNTLNIPTYTLSGLGGQPLATNLTSLAGLSYASTSFVKMTASGTFALDTNTYQTALTNPITGTGTSGQIGYFNGTTSLTSSSTFAFTPTSQLLVNNSITAASAIARGTYLTPTLTASANSDVLVGLDINPTFTLGAFTGTNSIGLRTQVASGSNKWNLYLSGTANNYLAGKLLIGTTTDAGFTGADITGTTRLNGLQTFVGTTASDGGQLGSELAAVTGTGTNWTLAGTNLNVGGYTHTTGSTTALTTSLAAVSGNSYQIVYTITGRTAGTINISFGGQTSGTQSVSGTVYNKASSTSVLTITPTTDFDGNVIISLKQVTAGSATTTFQNSSLASNIEVRASGVSNTNTFIGLNSGRYNVTGGTQNTSLGSGALASILNATNNTAIGYNAGTLITGANNATLIGQGAGAALTIGNNNTLIGVNAGQAITTTSNNTLIGYLAGSGNSGGSNNTAVGVQSLTNISTGTTNVAIGVQSGNDLTTGGSNVLIGYAAGRYLTSVGSNVIIGSSAGRFLLTQTSGTTLTTNNNSVFIGTDIRSGAQGASNEVVIAGYNNTIGQVGYGSNTTVIGNNLTTNTAIQGNLSIGSLNPVSIGSPVATPSTTGGTLAAGTYYYQIVAVDIYGNTTTGSQEVSATTTGTTSSVGLTWTAVTGAASYRIYRGTATNAQNVYYTSATNSFTDINGASTAGTVPTSNTTYLTRLNSAGSSVLGGNVLIGTSTDSGYKLDVNGTGRFSSTLLVSGAATFSSSVTATNFAAGSASPTYPINTSSASGTQALFNSTRTNGGGILLQSSGTEIMDIGTTNYCGFSGATGNDSAITSVGANNLCFGTNNTERMRITSGGNVGIGTSSPSTTLDVNGATKITGPGNTLTLAKSNNYPALAWQGATYTNVIESGDSYMAFTQSGSERMRITSEGQVYVGVSSGLNGTLNSATLSGQFALSLFDGFGNNAMVTIRNSSNAQVGSITIVSGTATAYNTTSDYRLKEDFKEIKGLEKVLQIKVYDFKWKSGEYRMDGVIAHELFEVIPYAVVGEKDAEEMQSVDYSKLVPILVKAIQEQNQIINDLKERILNLESK